MTVSPMKKYMMMLTTTAYMSERFNRDNIRILEELGYEVHVVANFDAGNPSDAAVLDGFRSWVEAHGGKCFSIAVTHDPRDFKNFHRAYRQCLDLIRRFHYSFIHCHTPVAGVLGRKLAHDTGTRVIYTAHGFHFYKGAPRCYWLLFYPVEKAMARWTDVLITINKEDFGLAKKKFRAKETIYLPGVGVDLKKWDNGTCDADAKRAELGLKDSEIMLLSVGELSDRKNHMAVIEALARLHREDHIDAEYFIAGVGRNRDALLKAADENNIMPHIHLLGYRTDIAELDRAADLFIFPSKQEGMPVALMEAIAAKCPVLCSDIRGSNELVTDSRCLFDLKAGPEEPNSLYSRLKRAIEKGRGEIKTSFATAIQENYEGIGKFDRSNTVKEMQAIYEKQSRY